MRRAVLVSSAVLAAACNSSPTGSSGATYSLNGRGSAPASVMASVHAASVASTGDRLDASVPVGSPSSVRLQVRGVWLSTSGSCANPVAVQAYDTPQTKDLLANPVLGTGELPAGNYACLLLEVSDSIAFTPASSGGACTAGSTYAIDIYRADNSMSPSDYWRDRAGAPITPQGTQGTIGAQPVVLAFTNDTAAAHAAGWAEYQTIALAGSVTAPGTNTFIWDFTGAVRDESWDGDGGVPMTACGLEGPMPRVE